VSVRPEILSRLAEHYGTPLYVYDLDELRDAYTDLVRSVPVGSRLFYSLKANPHPPLVRELLTAGADAEVCSSRELDTALDAGALAGSCLYTGPAKTETELGHALARGVRLFSVDSPTDLARLGRCARRAGVSIKAILRLNPADYPRGAGLAMGGTPSQFGADVAWVRAQPERFRADAVELVGYHVYVGTNSDDVERLIGWFDLALETVRLAQEALALRVELIDLGGGFGHPYARTGVRPQWSGLAGRLTELFEHRWPSDRLGTPTIGFESGRYLVGGCGSLVLRVQDVKTSKGSRFVIADGGINALGGMQGLRRVPPIMADVLPVTGTASAGRAEPAPDGADTVLAGPLCTALDLLNHRAWLPAVVPGDLLVVPNVGAYGLTASLLAFLGRDAPAEVVVDAHGVRSAHRLALEHRELPIAEPHRSGPPNAVRKPTGERAELR
jgi:diaminopimelate decarboxylase